MIHMAIDSDRDKGWFAGPWNSGLPIPVGYANAGVNEPHYHRKMYEVYLIAQGESTAVVEDKEIDLKAGDMLVMEPGEVHTFIRNSEDYLHFVIHTPFVKDDKEIVG